jgi:hypothetical protein
MIQKQGTWCRYPAKNIVSNAIVLPNRIVLVHVQAEKKMNRNRRLPMNSKWPNKRKFCCSKIA